ncbi:uroporphyrinogen-III C-methyltransferase [Subtercola frigoramans]|uniref:uroporphyrinogen-III C-methyltransferase n=1 Tax=Subtercola frigoramans TaxID=120298 RepID=A0ABS2L443_9MICO|nr:uroporphyrinogen-III C-methyltransferase [Subtercola frigoramans]MBM7471784.1 uroporphyrin-III C-methyltransferase [Subtercola frigoramans]
MSTQPSHPESAPRPAWRPTASKPILSPAPASPLSVSLSLLGRRVVVVGDALGTRRVRARYRAAGAHVELVTAGQARVLLAAGAADSALHTSAQHASALPASGLPASNQPASTPRNKLHDNLPDLLVWVDGRESQRADLAAAASRQRVWMTTEPSAPTLPRGHVTLIGGGPGETELMTVAGRTALAEADVVLYDRLAPTETLQQWAPGAELIDVGKLPGHHAVPQREIEAIMVDRALQGLHVVRLKGGDPFVFGRGGEEVLACRIAGVPVTVVPGVTSAISVPAAAGIPVTHRNVTRAFTVISGHAPYSEDELHHLAGLGGTIVVLMGVGTLVQLVSGLQRHGMTATMPLAIVEQGYSIHQRTTVSSVGEVTGMLGTLALRSPAVIVIGEVVRVASDDAASTGQTNTQETEEIIRAVAQLAT